MRPVELLRRRGVLQSPRAVRPDVHLADRADDAGVEDLADETALRGGVALVTHLGGEARQFRGGFPEQPGLPDVIGERLLAIHVLAVGEREVRREDVRVLGGGDDHCIKLLRVVEDLAEVGHAAGLREILPGGVEGEAVDVAENGHVLVGLRAGKDLGALR